MSVTHKMRRQYERTHRPQLIAAAGQKFIADSSAPPSLHTPLRLDTTPPRRLQSIAMQKPKPNAEIKSQQQVSFLLSKKSPLQFKQKRRIKAGVFDPSLLVHTVWDLGIGDPMAIGFYQRLGTELRMIDYYESNDKPLKHYVEVLAQKTYKYGRHFVPHDIAVRELSSGKSRLEMAKTLGISFETTPTCPLTTVSTPRSSCSSGCGSTRRAAPSSSTLSRSTGASGTTRRGCSRRSRCTTGRAMLRTFIGTPRWWRTR